MKLILKIYNITSNKKKMRQIGKVDLFNEVLIGTLFCDNSDLLAL